MDTNTEEALMKYRELPSCLPGFRCERAEVTHSSEKEKEESSSSATSNDDNSFSRGVVERELRRASSFAEKIFLMLDAPQTESTTGEDLLELICLT